MSHRLLTLVALALLWLSAAVTTADAQVNVFGRSGFEMSGEDLDQLNAASAKLYKDESRAVGDTESWTSPQSGTSGTVTLVRIYVYNYQGKDLDCRKLRHEITRDGVEGTLTFVSDRCRIEGTDEWKVR